MTEKSTTQEREPFAPFTKEGITRIYFGGDKVCRCGCAGEYFEPSDKGFDQKAKRFMRLCEEKYTEDSSLDGGTFINIRTSESGSAGKALTAYFEKQEEN